MIDGEIVFIPGQGEAPIVISPRSDLRLPGHHNLENALAAVAMAMAMEIDPAVIRRTLASFEGVEHRIEFVRRVNGIAYIKASEGRRTGEKFYDVLGWT